MNRKLFLIGLSFLSLSAISAQNNLRSENPIAFKYNLKQLGLKGKVKSVSMFGGNNKIDEYLFDTEGRITKISSSNRTQIFTYDPLKKIINVADHSYQFPLINRLYQYNKNGDVEYYLYKENDPLRKFEYNDLMLVKDSSANRFNQDKRYYNYYEYNKNGQVVLSRQYDDKHKLAREEFYKYEPNLIIISIKSYPTKVDGKVDEYEKKIYFDNMGNTIKYTFNSKNQIETIDYKLDNYGNWIWKSDGLTRKFEYY